MPKPLRIVAAVNLLVLALAVSTLTTATGPARPKAPAPGTAAAASGEEEEGGPGTEPLDWLNAQRAGGAAGVPAGALERALAQSAAIGAATAESAPEVAGAEWQLEGPTNIGGRVVDVVVDPVLADTIYIAAAGGGVWRSADKGANFTPAWPDHGTQAMGALAIGSDATLWAGTGEANPGGGSITFGGTGLYRSTDRGATWTRVGLQESGTIGRIVVDPKDPRRVLVAATGNLFLGGGERGLYETRDAGATWKRLLAGDNATTGAVDIALDPVNPQRILVAMWDHQRLPNLRRYGGVGSGVYRTADGGTTWAKVTGPTGLPGFTEDVGRIGIALAPSDPNRAYAMVVDGSGDPVLTPFYTSLDGGTTWIPMFPDANLRTSQSTFGWWFGRIYVDPANPLHVFASGVSLVESVNGGAVWTPSTGPHADQHSLAWDPKVPSRVYLGNDGGVYRSDTNGATASWTFAKYQPWTQLYSVDVGEKASGQLTAGAQDNGCNRRSAANPGPGSWASYGGCGDGLQTLINPSDNNIMYACSQYGSCSRSTNGGTSSSGIGATTSARRNWFTPLEFDPNNPSVMYYAGNILNRSTNGGTSWTAISPDLSGGDGPDPNYRFGTITAVAAAASDGQVLYAGTDDGRLWTTKDLGATWTRLEDPDLPGVWVTRVAVDPRDAKVAYASFSGFRNGADTAHLARTRDGGATWDNISAGLPAAPVNDVVLVGDDIVVATDVGVFLTRDGGGTWLRLGANLPLAPILDLRYHAPTGTITAATFGRSIWRVTLPPT